MKRIVALTPPDADNGFACCGAVQHAVTPGEAATAVMVAMEEADGGVVIVDERILEELGEENLHALERRYPGVTVVLPAPDVDSSGENYAMRMIRRAIGYQVKVKT